ncbi:uncharacterized protein [Rutidosis leptorrhynchoides]|uniref:uncharacterized protein n=1 Tax=Rutidosis leptorrhynchoides TaxID=125765 RepID=UPI003A9984E7
MVTNGGGVWLSGDGEMVSVILAQSVITARHGGFMVTIKWLMKEIDGLCLRFDMGGFRFSKGFLERVGVVKGSVLGDGRLTSAWYDVWSNIGRITEFVTIRSIFQAGLKNMDSVHDIIDNGVWKWPQSWYIDFPILQQLQVPPLSNSKDVILWKDIDGGVKEFTVSLAWNTLRPRATKVPWYRVVWFEHCIPRHAFLLWLLMGENLKTQDKLKDWERNASLSNSFVCALCKSQIDSHDHLFYNCVFSSQLCLMVSTLLEWPSWNNSWRDIRDSLVPYTSRRIVRVVVTKLAYAAMTYFIWQERNNRFFKGKSRTVNQVFEVIYSTVRMKILSLKFKDSSHLRVMKDTWKIP